MDIILRMFCAMGLWLDIKMFTKKIKPTMWNLLTTKC